MRRPEIRPGLWLRLVALRLAIVGVACVPASDAPPAPRSTLFVGVDISGSFQRDGRFDDAMEFASHYIHAHLAGSGELERPRTLFVGAIGGEAPGQPQAFHPIHDFEGKSVAEIETDLRAWFRPDDRLTDFNAFFQRAATLVKRQNLALAPITMVLLTDGVPDVGPAAAGSGEGSGEEGEAASPYRAIDLDELEYLARNVTVRVLYPEPTVAVRWEREIPRDRVRMWTVDAVVMRGWRDQLRMEEPEPEAPVTVASEQTPSADPGDAPDPGDAAEASSAPDPADGIAGEPSGDSDPLDASAADAALSLVEAEVPESAAPLEPRIAAEQPDLWRWIRDNVDFRVRRSVI